MEPRHTHTLTSDAAWKAHRNAYRMGWARDNYPRHVVTYILRNARRRARIQGVPFNITKTDIVIPDVCPILGIPITINSYYNDGRKGWGNSPSLDRIIPEKGYVPGNIHVISLRANRIKCDATLEELRLIYEYFRDNR